MQTFRSLFEPDCSSSFAHVLNALFPGTNQVSHTQAGMASSSTPQLPSLVFFWLFSGSCFPLQGSPAGGDFCTRVQWSPPRGNSHGFTKRIWWYSCKGWKANTLYHTVFQGFCVNLNSPGSGWTRQLYFGGRVAVQNFALYTQGLRIP